MKTIPSYNGIFVRLIILVLGISQSACSLFDPYIDPADLKFKSDSTMTTPCITIATTMQSAVDCATVVRSEYISGMSDQSVLSSVSGVSLIALTAYTAGIAINDAHPTNVTDFSLGTAGLFGMSQWLSQPQRTKVYGLGAKALQCAVDASAPFLANGSRITDFEADILALNLQINLAASKLDTVQALLASNTQSNTTATALAKAKVVSARSAIEQARSSAETAAKLVAVYHKAPQALVNAVNRINTSVNAGMGDTIQSLSALPGTLNGMMAMYANLVSGFAAQGYSPAGGGDDSEKVRSQEGAGGQEILGLSSIMGKLDSEIEVLAGKRAAVDLGINSLKPELPGEAIEECGVDLSNVSKTIVISPGSLTFGDSSAAMLSVEISGGAGKYVFSHDADSLDIKQVTPFGSVLQIKPMPNASPGIYKVTVEDTSGGSKILDVTIGKTTTASPASPGQSPGSTGCNAYVEGQADANLFTTEACDKRFADEAMALSEAEREVCMSGTKTSNLQIQIKQKQPDSTLCPDGIYGKATREALVAVLKADGTEIDKDNPITEDHLKSIATAPPPPAPAPDPAEPVVTAEEL